MKLYNLFEEIILEGLITEGVNTDQISKAIDGELANNGRKFIRRYRIHYDGDDVKDEYGNVTREGKGWRNVVPHAYGKLKNGGREAIRAYQVYGDSLRNGDNSQGWKLFRLDRITHWEPTNLKYWNQVEISGQPTNMDGDKSMSEVFKIVNFDSNDENNGDNTTDNKYFDTRANTYKYDNADSTETEPTNTDKSDGNVEDTDDNTPTFDNKEDGVGFDDVKIKNVLDDKSENEYEEEDIEDENDEIKKY